MAPEEYHTPSIHRYRLEHGYSSYTDAKILYSKTRSEALSRWEKL